MEEEAPQFEETTEDVLVEDLTEKEQTRAFFCDTNGENYYVLGFCVGKVVTYWLGGIIAALGGLSGIVGYLFN